MNNDTNAIADRLGNKDAMGLLHPYNLTQDAQATLQALREHPRVGTVQLHVSYWHKSEDADCEAMVFSLPKDTIGYTDQYRRSGKTLPEAVARLAEGLPKHLSDRAMCECGKGTTGMTYCPGCGKKVEADSENV